MREQTFTNVYSVWSEKPKPLQLLSFQ